MTMMHVGYVRMRMCQRCVLVSMGVWFAQRITRLMSVVMMLVVSVRMGMLQRLVSVRMLVMLS